MKINSKKFLLTMAMFCFYGFALSQPIDTLLYQAQTLEYKLKETEALEKYKAVLVADAVNMKALTKAAELSILVGARLPNIKDKKLYFQSAFSFAERALNVDANNAEANYVMALVKSKLADIEKENKVFAENIRATKLFADKALAINSQHAKANFIAGNWHLEMSNLSAIKKTAVKVLFGGLPQYSLDSAIYYFEKCKNYDQYYMLNYLALAKAYMQDNSPTKAIAILQKLIKLPLRTADDVTIKEEGKKLLAELE